MNVKTAAQTIGVTVEVIHDWLDTIEENYSPAEWNRYAEEFYLNELVASNPVFVPNGEALPFDEDDQDWKIEKLNNGNRFVYNI